MRRLLALLIVALLAGGCGLGAGAETGGTVSTTVSQDFGATQLAPTRTETAHEGETVMRLLQRTFDDVETRFGGNFVQEIGGVSGGREDGKRVDWFYYVNGIEAAEGAGDRPLHPGDRVWWDHHRWDAAMRIPAVVGAFPEPFKSGTGGKKLPIRLVCLGADRSCDEVVERLEAADVGGVARSNLESSPGEVLRVLVGRWADVRKDIAARTLEEGPAVSGVFARPAASGAAIELLDADGEVARTLGPGSGLIATASYEEQPPSWLITGTDDVGVAAAAAALTEEQLRAHFALAIDAGRGVPLPLTNAP